jgi:hypothetical protein
VRSRNRKGRHQLEVGLAEGAAVGLADGFPEGAGEVVGDTVGVSLGLREAASDADGEIAGELADVVRGTAVVLGPAVGTTLGDGLMLGNPGGDTTRTSIRKSKLGIVEAQSGDTVRSTSPNCERNCRASLTDLPTTPARS